MIKPPKRLTGQDLADAFAIAHRYLGNVWAHYEGGGWITLRGENLEAAPEMKHLYPNGWSLLDRTRTTSARKYLHALTAP